MKTLQERMPSPETRQRGRDPEVQQNRIKPGRAAVNNQPSISALGIAHATAESVRTLPRPVSQTTQLRPKPTPNSDPNAMRRTRLYLPAGSLVRPESSTRE
eukprot:1190955-Prorocentrum_minimum.AAC.5